MPTSTPAAPRPSRWPLRGATTARQVTPEAAARSRRAASAGAAANPARRTAPGRLRWSAPASERAAAGRLSPSPPPAPPRRRPKPRQVPKLLLGAEADPVERHPGRPALPGGAAEPAVGLDVDALEHARAVLVGARD